MSLPGLAGGVLATSAQEGHREVWQEVVEILEAYDVPGSYRAVGEASAEPVAYSTHRPPPGRPTRYLATIDQASPPRRRPAWFRCGLVNEPSSSPSLASTTSRPTTGAMGRRKYV